MTPARRLTLWLATTLALAASVVAILMIPGEQTAGQYAVIITYGAATSAFVALFMELRE